MSIILGVNGYHVGMWYFHFRIAAQIEVRQAVTDLSVSNGSLSKANDPHTAELFHLHSTQFNSKNTDELWDWCHCTKMLIPFIITNAKHQRWLFYLWTSVQIKPPLACSDWVLAIFPAKKFLDCAANTYANYSDKYKLSIEWNLKMYVSPSIVRKIH